MKFLVVSSRTGYGFWPPDKLKQDRWRGVKTRKSFEFYTLCQSRREIRPQLLSSSNYHRQGTIKKRNKLYPVLTENNETFFKTLI